LPQDGLSSFTFFHLVGGFMLVLTRSARDGGITIGDDIHIAVVRVDGDKVRIGITAPDGVRIWRDELLPLVRSEGPQKVVHSQRAAA
jgi:carbon storage regulator